MPRPASEAEKTVALAFVLLHGNPPKGLQFDHFAFRFRGQEAKNYANALHHMLRREIPNEYRTCEGVISHAKLKEARNRCLRYIMGVK